MSDPSSKDIMTALQTLHQQCEQFLDVLAEEKQAIIQSDGEALIACAQKKVAYFLQFQALEEQLSQLGQDASALKTIVKQANQQGHQLAYQDIFEKLRLCKQYSNANQAAIHANMNACQREIGILLQCLQKPGVYDQQGQLNNSSCV